MAETLLRSGRCVFWTFGGEVLESSGWSSAPKTKTPSNKMETRNQLVGRLLSSGKINSNEAIILLQDGEVMETTKKKSSTPPEAIQRGLLTDIPHHSPLPIIPTGFDYSNEPKTNAAGKDCKCTDCKCGANPE